MTSWGKPVIFVETAVAKFYRNMHIHLSLALFFLADAVWAKDEKPFAFDTSIEGLRSQEFSVGMFYFLAFCIFVFTAIVFAYMFKGKGSRLKTGEKIMFVWILIGIVVSVIFAATQMLHGYLF